jgi:hypothetical protein
MAVVGFRSVIGDAFGQVLPQVRGGTITQLDLGLRDVRVKVAHFAGAQGVMGYFEVRAEDLVDRLQETGRLLIVRQTIAISPFRVASDQEVGVEFERKAYSPDNWSGSMSHPDTQWTDSGREQVFAEALHQPETPEEASAQQAKFRAWRKDPGYQHLWTMLDRLIQPLPVSEAEGVLPARGKVGP